jgi:hypothetical protein
MVDEYRRALCAPFHEAAYGARKDSPRVVMLAKNVERETNKVAETTVRLSLFALKHVGLEAARRPFQTIDAMLSARMPAPDLSLDKLQLLETEIESAINPIQVQYLMGDRSTQVKLELLERFRRYRDVLNQIIARLERELFGVKP